jgi:glycosyltransferase involved in cell wall biosynthesis
MNKVLEYMAMARPIVSFELIEARHSAGDAAVYVPANDEEAFAQAISDLLDDPARRAEMGQSGRRRLEEHLSWDSSRQHLVEFYQRLMRG